VRWLTHTHTQRYHAHYHTSGTGHLYQGRFKSFPIESDARLLVAGRYVERNALRAKLVARAEDWPWCSLFYRHRNLEPGLLSDWPLELPADWIEFVNESPPEAELAALRQSVRRSSPYGREAWQSKIARELGLEATLRPQGRPRRIVEAVLGEQLVL